MLTKKTKKSNTKPTKRISPYFIGVATITTLFIVSGCDMKMSKHETEEYNLNQKADQCYKYSTNEKKYSMCLERLGFNSTPLIETYNPYYDFKGGQ